MNITFLGTGTSQGIPMIACDCPVCNSNDPRDKRLRTALMVEAHGERIIIDTGPDFRAQMLKHQVKSISGVLLTHEHYDHIAGIDDLRSFNFAMHAQMHIWAENRVIETLYKQFAYVFEKNKYPGTPNLALHSLNIEPFKIGKLEIIPIRLLHYKLPVMGFRIGNMAYLTDVSCLPDEEYSKLENLDLLIIDALRMKPHISHFNLEQALEVINKLNPKQARLTHISHSLGKHIEVQKLLPSHIRPAYDGLMLKIPF